ncbi:uncharacterized protein LOC143914066 [Arctopsyche grandis]|uniref:uncharacterized protein LOC143914066 n=1 Tax=Arctopsyche grandis TaxID=121162 RepID=UPI00406D86D3
MSGGMSEGPCSSHEVPERIWMALKRHIIRERQRKKEEHEAEVEEERLRREREARERQDVMTLGETREQIQQLEHKLTKLKDEKHQLFLQLKKVLNEDDNRKRQQFKDANEMMANMNGIVPSGNMVPSLFFPTSVSQGNSNMGRPPLSAQVLNMGAGGIKRGRSPSPPYAQSQPNMHNNTQYMHHPHHKQQQLSSPYQGPPPHKVEDGRCREMTSRAILWNKAPMYGSSGSGSAFYAIPQPVQKSVPMTYAASLYHPHHVQHHPPPKQVSHSPYHVVIGLGESHQQSYLSQPPPSIPPSSSAPPVPSSSVVAIRHSNQQQMLSGPPPVDKSMVPMQHNSVQAEYKINPAKPGGITTGYPVRQQNPSVQNPNLYPSRHRY